MKEKVHVRRVRERNGGLSPRIYLSKPPTLRFLFCFFFPPRDEKQFSLTKHFPAYLQTGGRAGGREGDWGSSRNVRKVKGCNKGFGASKQIAVKAARGRGEVDEEEGGKREGIGREEGGGATGCWCLLKRGMVERKRKDEMERMSVCVSLVYVFGDPSM